MKDKRRRGIVLALALTAGLLGACSAGATPPERNACPGKGWDLMTVERINETLTTGGPGSEDAAFVASIDESGNDDGLLCVHVLPTAVAIAQGLPFDPLFVVADNTFVNPNSVVVDDARIRPVAQGRQ
jgi:hypothetical protein